MTIRFSYDGFNFIVDDSAYDSRGIVLPDGRVLVVDGWFETMPPQPQGLHEVPHLYTSNLLKDIARFMSSTQAAYLDMVLDYSIPKTPALYVCQQCGASGVKLWRHLTELYPRFICAACAAKAAKIDIRGIDSRGVYLSGGGLTDKIGSFNPCIPDEEGLVCTNKLHASEAGLQWWYGLPLSN